MTSCNFDINVFDVKSIMGGRDFIVSQPHTSLRPPGPGGPVA